MSDHSVGLFSFRSSLRDRTPSSELGHQSVANADEHDHWSVQRWAVHHRRSDDRDPCRPSQQNTLAEASVFCYSKHTNS